MNNRKLMEQFTDTYDTEIAALINDLELQDVRISFDGRRPQGLREDPTLIWEYHPLQSNEDAESGFAIRFAWDNLVANNTELRYGLIALATCFHTIAQRVAAVRSQLRTECMCDTCIELAHQALLEAGRNYAYEVVQRLFMLFTNDEINAMREYGCTCKECRQEALRRLRQHRPTLAA